VINDPLKEAEIRDQKIYLDIWYPRIEGNPDTLHLGLMDVRASDGIRINYDFERDGWSIKQQAFHGHDTWSSELKDWVEVAFVQSWAREIPCPAPDTCKDCAGVEVKPKEETP